MSDIPTRPEPPEKPTGLRKAPTEQNVAKSATEKKSVAKKSSREVLKSLASVPVFFLNLKADDLADRGSTTWTERCLHESARTVVDAEPRRQQTEARRLQMHDDTAERQRRLE